MKSSVANGVREFEGESVERALTHSPSHFPTHDAHPLTLATPWLFSPAVDLLVFGGSAAVALVLVAVGWQWGLLASDTPDWTWVGAILLVDVAHVYATAFRVYLDPAEFARRKWVYLLAPALGYVIGVALYSEGAELFWRTLAYLAVFHFVRQQYGWVAMYRARGGEHGRIGWWVDATAIYLATIYPLVYWHSHLPRSFWWFLPNDFTALPEQAAAMVAPFYWAAMAAYAGRSAYRVVARGEWNPGKDLVVATTAICWYVGIVALDSDYAFTVTNVIIHGVPYIVLVWWFRNRETVAAADPGDARRWLRFVPYLATLWMLAYVEELLWDRGVWHERSWLFGGAWNWDAYKPLVIPLLAVPQLTHYILDGFIWKRRSNPDVVTLLHGD
jgi:hypothetical protein